MKRPFSRRRRRPAHSKHRAMFRRPPPCPLRSQGLTDVDYKDVELLSRYLTDEHRIAPSAYTNVSAGMQRKLKRAIKQARHLALLPYTRSHALKREK